MYFWLRVTPEFCDPSFNLGIFRKMIKLYDIDQYVIGYELLNCYLEPTKPHYHFHFICSDVHTHETIQHWLTDNGIKGKDAKCLKSGEEPDIELDRWWRYPMKEKMIECNVAFTNQEIINMTLIAKDERLRAASYHKRKRDDNKKKSSLFERLSLELDGMKPPPTSPQAIYKAMILFYMKNNNCINPRTIAGYMHLYMLHHGIIPVDDYVRQYYQVLN